MDQGGVDILDRQIGEGVNLLSTPVSGPPHCPNSVTLGISAKNQIAICNIQNPNTLFCLLWIFGDVNNSSGYGPKIAQHPGEI